MCGSPVTISSLLTDVDECLPLDSTPNDELPKEGR